MSPSKSLSDLENERRQKSRSRRRSRSPSTVRSDRSATTGDSSLFSSSSGYQCRRHDGRERRHKSSKSHRHRKHKHQRRESHADDDRSSGSPDSDHLRRRRKKRKAKTRSRDRDNENIRDREKYRDKKHHRRRNSRRKTRHHSSSSSSGSREKDCRNSEQGDKASEISPPASFALDSQQDLKKLPADQNTTYSASVTRNQQNQEEQQQKAARAAKMAPMTREQYETQQSVIREVYDPDTGRTRLVRGTGEIIERIVRREEHAQINRIATAGDGTSYARGIIASAATASYPGKK